ncbi:histidine phosphatase family protein [Mycobacterium sp. ITM-2016-00316]|uniref:histidine phosphatase family protein n=1 Tax=Mycobacterium sp. ITM-2016-00316 TaxID=2099695 RepID=UPI0018ED8B44|nr:histidine phosphatase family protein [Mycobacterium sp. ITM-2016-00316]WNG81450.1 histidine phosphatase family protein [Mycobacterium sp. ITM-2016-00316]
MVTRLHGQSLKLLLAALTAGVLFVITALPAAAMTVTFVRHGESEANASHTIDNSIPGAPLTPLGQTQAAAVAAALAAGGVAYDAIYASNMRRTTETAAPFAAASGLTPTVLPGFREINAGWFERSSDSGLGGIGYVLAPALWTLGARSVPVPGGGDGNAFDARMDAALKIVEESGAQNPVVFSHAATIMFWTMMNVDNPDLGLMLRHRLDNTGIVVVEGSAEEGWTLKTWAGLPVGPASLGTKLFVNARDLVVTPQTAAHNVVRAFGTGDIAQIATAIRDGVGAVVRAPITFTVAVVRDVVDEVTRKIRPSAPDTTTTDALATTAQARTTAPEAADAVAPEPENAAPVKKLRTARTVKKPGRPSVAFTEKDPRTADLRTDRKVSPITPKQAARPESKPADGDSGAEKEAA